MILEKFTSWIKICDLQKKQALGPGFSGRPRIEAARIGPRLHRDVTGTSTGGKHWKWWENTWNEQSLNHIIMPKNNKSTCNFWSKLLKSNTKYFVYTYISEMYGAFLSFTTTSPATKKNTDPKIWPFFGGNLPSAPGHGKNYLQAATRALQCKAGRWCRQHRSPQRSPAPGAFTLGFFL